MKILVISNLFAPYILGGYEILCGQVVDFLRKKGHTVTVLTSDYGLRDADAGAAESAEPAESAESATKGDGVIRRLKLYRYFPEPAGLERKNRSRTALYNRKVTENVLGQLKPELVFIWSLLRLTPGAARAAERSAVPVLYSFNDENITSFAKHRFGLKPRKFYRWFFDTFIYPEITVSDLAFSHVACISEVTKRNIISHGVPAAASAEIIYQGIPIHRFPVKKEKPGMLHNPVRILYAGQVHPYKGVLVLVRALALLNQQNKSGTAQKNGTEEKKVPANKVPASTLTIAGTGDKLFQQELIREAEKGGVSVNFLGITLYEDMPAVYRNHDVLVFPSIWEEPFGLTHLEAMASGLPVISTDNGGQRVFLRDGENALTCSPDDVPGLADALKRMLLDEELRERIAREGRKTVERDFTFRRYADSLEKKLLSLLPPQ
ncbi:MAG: glycosyltransferase family 4 protein [Spirochaetales bacterium]|nr:glycosyltransferase family 4 protein [Spirochaetales bacterium]